MSLKKWDIGFGAAGNKVTPDEIGFDMTFSVINPSISNEWFGTCKGTSTQAVAITAINPISDYPRNLRINVDCASGSTKGGTAVINGKDQFGSVISESLVVTTAANGGTTLGTKVFDQFTSGTFTFDTCNAGNGTVHLGVGTAGTTSLFGLPWRLGGTTDIKKITGSFAGVGTSTAGTFVFGGTPSSSADTTNHAFKLPLDLQAGTCVYHVRVRPTYIESNETV
jgi:hypothetical protein